MANQLVRLLNTTLVSLSCASGPVASTSDSQNFQLVQSDNIEDVISILR